jgi:hypothetical protein
MEASPEKSDSRLLDMNSLLGSWAPQTFSILTHMPRSAVPAYCEP